MMTLGECISIGVGLIAIAGPAITYGMLRQKVKDLEEDIKPLATKESVESLEAALGNFASRESVVSIGGRVASLETDMREAREALSTIPKVAERLDGLKELMTSQLDELKHGMREVRNFLTPPRAPRKPPQQ